MNKEEYFSRLEKAIEFIESKLNSQLLLSEVSQHAFSSLSHFHRIFFFMTGMTLKDYIRKRRLSKAGMQLISTQNKIIDIALEAQFDSPESFSKAFKKQFELTPREFRSRKPEFELMRKIELDCYDNVALPDNMTLNFVFLPEQIITGAKTRTTLANHQQAKDIPKFFQNVMTKNLFDSIPEVIHLNKIFGVYSDMSDEEEFDYTVGLAVKIPFNNLQYSSHILPAAEYARFTVNGDASKLEYAWRYIYGSWMPYSGRSRQKGLDFEVYFPDKTDIYIPMLPQA
ncbi:MAG: AraC family transcriptional regulator [Gammaproteobacteria bacterium]|jgi:AraC family transcriptional regulator|nr:AraC family transcriptional regulator [Gammaproteobacteria bacterium]